MRKSRAEQDCHTWPSHLLLVFTALLCPSNATKVVADNLLGIDIRGSEEAEPLLRRLGAPELGPRRCVVVTAVDASGPCAGHIELGFGLRKINDIVVQDVDSFTEVVKTLQPGQSVLLEGLYVRSRNGQNGAWAVGRATIRTRGGNETPSDVDPSRPRTDAARPYDQQLRRLDVPLIEQANQGFNLQPEHPTRSSPHVESPSTERAIDDGTDTLDYMPQDIPYIPLPLRLNEFPGYDVNDPAYSAMDYTNGPRGEMLHTLHIKERMPYTEETVPATISGFLVGDPSDVPPKTDFSALQEYLFRAHAAKRFRKHGLVVYWTTSGELPSIAEAATASSKHLGDAGSIYDGHVRPRISFYAYDDAPLGIRRVWDATDKEPRLVCCCLFDITDSKESSAIHHLTREKRLEDGVFETDSLRFGIPHGRFKSFFPDGQPKLCFNSVNGVRQGEEQEWHENGSLKIVHQLKDGKTQGREEQFHSNGMKKSVGLLENDELVADEEAWNEDGEKVEGRKKPLTVYANAFEVGRRLGEGHRNSVDQITRTGRFSGMEGVLDDVVDDMIGGPSTRFLGDLLKAQRDVGSGGDPRLLEHAQGFHDGYKAGVGPYAR